MHRDLNWLIRIQSLSEPIVENMKILTKEIQAAEGTIFQLAKLKCMIETGRTAQISKCLIKRK